MCAAGWLPSSASGTCLKVYRVSRDFQDARNTCIADNGDLVTIIDDEMNLFVMGISYLGFSSNCVLTVSYMIILQTYFFLQSPGITLRYAYTKLFAASNTIPQNAWRAQAAIRITCDLWKVA